MSRDPEPPAAAPEPEGDAGGPALELERSWILIHEVMDQLTPARLQAQRLLSRLRKGDDPNGAELREAILRIDLATLNAIGLLKRWRL